MKHDETPRTTGFSRMRNPICSSFLILHFSFAISLALAPRAARAANPAAVPAQAVTPCTYVGRLMDAEHVGFDPNDCLSIVSFRRAGQDVGAKDVLSFECRSGRSYHLEVTDSLENPNWQPKEFTRDENGTPINYINVPATGSSEETPTVYLLPQTGPKAFYRIKAD